MVCLCSGHAKGLKALSGEHLEFCDDSYRQIYNDPEVPQYNIICVKIFGDIQFKNFAKLNPQTEAVAY